MEVRDKKCVTDVAYITIDFGFQNLIIQGTIM